MDTFYIRVWCRRIYRDLTNPVKCVRKCIDSKYWVENNREKERWRERGSQWTDRTKITCGSALSVTKENRRTGWNSFLWKRCFRFEYKIPCQYPITLLVIKKKFVKLLWWIINNNNNFIRWVYIYDDWWYLFVNKQNDKKNCKIRSKSM